MSNLLDLISVELTRSCNARCPGCFIPPNSKEITTKELFQFLNNNLKYVKGSVTLTGGECTLKKELPEVINLIHHHNLPVSMISNGSWKPELLKKIEPDEIKLSLDFPDKRHDTRRGIPNLFDNITKTLLPAIKDHGILPKLLCTVHKPNMGCIDEMIALSVELGVKLAFVRYVPGSLDDPRTPSQDELKEIFRKVGVYKSGGYDVEWFGGLGCHVPGSTFFCSAGIDKLHITAAGDVTMCMYFFKKYGTITEGLRKIHKRTLNARVEYEKKVMERCGKCPNYNKTCAGDCMVIAEVFGDVKGQCWMSVTPTQPCKSQPD